MHVLLFSLTATKGKNPIHVRNISKDKVGIFRITVSLVMPVPKDCELLCKKKLSAYLSLICSHNYFWEKKLVWTCDDIPKQPHYFSTKDGRIIGGRWQLDLDFAGCYVSLRSLNMHSSQHAKTICFPFFLLQKWSSTALDFSGPRHCSKWIGWFSRL